MVLLARSGLLYVHTMRILRPSRELVFFVPLRTRDATTNRLAPITAITRNGTGFPTGSRRNNKAIWTTTDESVPLRAVAYFAWGYKPSAARRTRMPIETWE